MAAALILLFLIGYYIFKVFFCISFYKTVRVIPEAHQVFPAWFSWMMLIPLVGYIFEWLMLPFGLPSSMKKFFPSQVAIMKTNSVLFGLGLAYVIVALTIPFIGLLNLIIVPTLIALLIIYWVNVVKIRQLIKAETTEQQTHGTTAAT